MLVGAAVNFAVGGLACTVTVAAEVAVPFTLVAVNVYSVVDDGETAIDPDEATTPMPLLIVTVEAYAVVHDNVAELPGATVAGEAVRVAVGTTGAHEREASQHRGNQTSSLLRYRLQSIKQALHGQIHAPPSL